MRHSYLPDDFFGSEIQATVRINNLFDYKPTLTGQIGGFESRLINNFYRQFWISIDWTPGGQIDVTGGLSLMFGVATELRRGTLRALAFLSGQ